MLTPAMNRSMNDDDDGIESKKSLCGFTETKRIDHDFICTASTGREEIQNHLLTILDTETQIAFTKTWK